MSDVAVTAKGAPSLRFSDVGLSENSLRQDSGEPQLGSRTYVVVTGTDMNRTKRDGWGGRNSCVVTVIVFVAVGVVAAAFGLATYFTDARGGGSGVDGSDTYYCPEGLNETACERLQTSGADKQARQAVSSSSSRVAVVLGNGCFWERQYAYAMIEYTNPLFERSLYNLSARSGYAGSLKDGVNGRVCYHHAGGSSGDIYSTLGHAEGVVVWLDNDDDDNGNDDSVGNGGGGEADDTSTAVAAMTTTATQQFALLFQDFLDSFSYSASKGGNSRPDVGDKGAEYRSFLVRCFGGWWMLRGCGHNSLGPCTPCMESARAHALAPACVRAWRNTVDGLQSHHFGALRGVQSPAPPRT